MSFAARDCWVGRRLGLSLSLVVAVGLFVPTGAFGAPAGGGDGGLAIGDTPVANQVPEIVEQNVAPVVQPAKQLLDQTSSGATETADRTSASVVPVVKQVTGTAGEAAGSVAPVVRRVSETAARTVGGTSAPVAGLVSDSREAVGLGPSRQVDPPSNAPSANQPQLAGHGPSADSSVLTGTLFSAAQSMLPAAGADFAQLGSAGLSGVLAAYDDVQSSDPARAVLDVVGSAGAALGSVSSSSGSAGGGIGLATIVLFSLAVAIGAHRFSAGGLLFPSAPFVLLSERPG